MIIIVCDRCGARIDNSNMRRLTISSNEGSVLKGTDRNGKTIYGEDTIDNIQLCRKCAAEIISSLGPEVQGRLYKPEESDG